MSKDKQIIEDMAEDLRYCHTEFAGDYGDIYTDYRKTAEKLVVIGYRKQSEWISVEERLPEKDGRYLVAMKNGNNYHISTRKFKRADPPIWWKGHSYGYWARYTGGVRYWMPLPEPPKKGGAE